MPSFDSSELLDGIERRAFLESTNSDLSAAELLAFADEELRGLIIPTLLPLREELWVFCETQSLTSGRSYYRIPQRAALNKLRDAWLVLSDGSEKALKRVQPEDKIKYRRADTQDLGEPDAFYLEGANVVLLPTPGSGYSLKCSYFVRPGALLSAPVAASSGNYMVSTGASGAVISGAASSVPSTWTTSTKVDLYKASSPFEPVLLNQSISSLTTSSITIGATVPSTWEANDIVVVAGTALFPLLPADLHPLLQQAAACRALSVMGFTEKAAEAAQIRDRMLAAAVEGIQPRVEGETKSVEPTCW